MTIPPGHTFDSWFQAIIGKCGMWANRISVFREYWSFLTVAQRTSVKNEVKAGIDTTIAELTAFKADIDAI